MNTSTELPYLSDDWSTIKGSGLLSAERISSIESDLAARTKPLVTQAGKTIENAYVLSHLNGKDYIVLVSDYMTVERHQKALIAELLTPDEIKLVNDKASSRWAAQKEVSDYLKATKVSDLEYQGGVWWGDDYFSSVEDMLDRVACDSDNPDDIPEYVWAENPIVVITDLSVADVVESDIDNRGWEDMSVDDLNGTAELQAALDRFVKANETVYSYLPDYKTAVVISPKTRAELAAQMEAI